MHDDGVRLESREPLVCQAEERPVFADTREGGEPLALVLDAEQIDDVSVGEGVVDVVCHAATHLLEDAWHERRRAAERDVRAELGQRPNVRAGHAAVKNVAKNGDVQAAHVALFLENSEGVEQRLRGVLVRAVAGVDDATVDHPRQQVRRALRAVADDDNVGAERLERFAGVQKRFALGERRRLGGEVDHVGVKPHGGQLETDARAGGRLDEKIDHRASAQGRHFFDRTLTDRLEGASGVEDDANLVGTQRLNVEQMFASPIHSLGLMDCSVTVSSPPVSLSETSMRSSSAVGTFLPTKSGLIGSSRWPRSISTASWIRRGRPR